MRRSLLTLILVLYSTNGWAIVITGITGVSGSAITSTQPAPPNPNGGTPPAPTPVTTSSAFIYGGMAGNGGCVQNGAPCDTCPQTIANVTAAQSNSCFNQSVLQSPLCSCNQAAVYDALNATVSATFTAPVTVYYACMTPTATVGGTCTLVATAQIGSALSIPWSILCEHMTGTGATGGQTCAALIANGGVFTGTAQLTIFADTQNQPGVFTTGDESLNITVNLYYPGDMENVYGAPGTDGVSNFSTFPGDGRVYLDQITGTLPALTEGGTVTLIRVYYSTIDLDHATTELADNHADLTLDTTNSPTPQYVQGLTNGDRYFFRMAVLDQANNIMENIPDTAANLLAATGIDCSAAAAPNYPNCPYTAIPDQVLGILSHDINCFIASAAYGSAMEPKLQTFREFRYKTLLHSEWGKRFVYAYYRYGPYPARYISDKPVLRAMARGLLWPLYGVAWLSNRYGFTKALLVSLILAATMLALPWYGIRRYTARV